VACHRPIGDTYYEINGKVFCESCRTAVQLSRSARGGGFLRFVRAVTFGIGAGIVGFLIYFAVLKFTGVNAALVSILVGFMVGTAVRAGSNHRGGWLYQTLAVALTYTAVVQSFGAVALPQMIEQADQAFQQAGAKARLGAPVPPKIPRPVVVAVAVINTAVISFAIPFLGGLSPIGVLIVAFALWEAWKLNKRVPIVFRGPFRIGGDPALGEAPAHA
jgi:hypothetical protein